MAKTKEYNISCAMDFHEILKAYKLVSKIFKIDYKWCLRKIRPNNYRKLDNAIILKENNRIIGFIQIGNKYINFLDRKTLTAGLTSVCIDPRYQGLGLGRKMMEYAISLLKERNYELTA